MNLTLFQILDILEDSPAGVFCNGELMDDEEVINMYKNGETIHTITSL